MDFQLLLEKIGLNKKEVKIYLTLLEAGELKIAELLEKTTLARGDLYYALDNLVERGLVAREDKHKKLHFRLTDPALLGSLIDEKKAELNQLDREYSSFLPAMISAFNLSSNQPVVRFGEGLAGLKSVYSALNNSGQKELYLIRSVFDDKHTEINLLIEHQIKKQIRLGIKTFAITPLAADTRESFQDDDEMRLVERRIVDPKLLTLPAQILMWGDTVAVVSLRREIIATIIDNPDIAKSMRNLFDFIWQSSVPYHDEIMRHWSLEQK